MSIEADPNGPGGAAPATRPDGQPHPAAAPDTAPGGEEAGASSLRVGDLTLSFGQHTILSGISADIRKGTITALIGPTGSGKTTLLRTFNRMNDKVTGYRYQGDVLLRAQHLASRR